MVTRPAGSSPELPGTIRIGRAAAEARYLPVGLCLGHHYVDLMSANPGRIQLEDLE